ncbi:ribonuclease HII [Reyranella sp. CPCC 100927]|uniref:ribonuclease HII n=1 Tax=Reyranella sp. CPCC 100927 TaxID=2599616 RepID=UPI0011B3893D|nr:ribonuclease HII [Reyranella sp. CPCC 100927]TWT02801.1 ribonuclease HII [Reyranella sp. CPCC 100927]
MPHFRFETRFEGPVAGIDEAGRGPLAGPVLAAAVVLDRTRAKRSLLRLLDDSKKLTAEDREKAFQALRKSDAVLIGVGAASAREIDRFNILQATFLAMRRAVGALPAPPCVALVDGNRPPRLACPVELIVSGDSRSYSIAAASIIAKVTRDRIMHRLHERHPGYGWSKNVGYSVPEHLAGLQKLGPTPHHRFSFAPLGRLL